MNRATVAAGLLTVGLLSGCASNHAASSPATPDIVAKCRIINYPQPSVTALDNAEADNFNGPGQGRLINASADDRAPGYQITLANNGSAPVMVNGTDTVLFTGKQELTSDQESIGQLFSPGASLTFTFPIPPVFVTSQTDNWGNPVDYATSADSCAVEQWN